MSRRCLWIASLVPFMAAVALTNLGVQAQRGPEPPPNPADEAFIQTPAGFDKQGKPATVTGQQVGRLQVTVRDRQTGKPAHCRVNVVGADGAYYEPADNILAPWSLQRLGNRAGKGPIRYYGWFFYTPGEFVVDVPAGAVSVEVWKGYEYRPIAVSTRVASGSTRELTIELERTLPMAPAGYFSGDTHIHLNRGNPADDERALDLMAAEDIRHGFILCMNEPSDYTGTMERQLWPQQNGFGPSSAKRRGPYAIASGQEYRCGTYGHICLLMHRRMVLEGATVNPNNWPVFGMVGEETRRLGGYSFHAHGGYSREIYADFTQQTTDGVELLQFAQYRGISLEGWYRILSVGFRFPGVGASDYPYCRALGDCRTYVHLSGEPSFEQWSRNAAAGNSFFTTGPMVLLEVDGRKPGETLDKAGAGPHRVNVRLRARCEVAPITDVEVIVHGQVVERLKIPASAGQGQWIELEHSLELKKSSWIAARAYSTSASGQPDAEAHTNPVYVVLDGKLPYRQADLDWLLERLAEETATLERRQFPERADALAYYQKSRDKLLEIRRAAGLPAHRTE